MQGLIRRAAILASPLLALVVASGLGCGSGSLTQSSSKTGANSKSLWSSSRPGMGAIPYDTGTTFRVWAPNAYKVLVAGDFNGWQPTEIGNEFNGNFSMDYEGAHPGANYKYQIQQGGNTFYRTDPRAQECQNSAGNSVIHEPGFFNWKHDQDFKFPAVNERVVYEMHIGTYDDSPGFGPGNWQSAIAKLGHLSDLGISVVEVMPVHEFPGDFSWGYNPSVPFAPESSYGSTSDMKQFVDTAHSLGIAVVLDVVYNHFGPTDLGFWNFDGPDLGNGGIYFYTDGRAATPWGNTRPDYGRQEVQDYIADNASQWLNEYHVDGLRVDATYAIRGNNTGDDPNGWNLLKRITALVHQGPAPKFAIAEDDQTDADITDPSGAGFDSQWDTTFNSLVVGAITAGDDGSRNLADIQQAIQSNFNGDFSHRVIYTESHDSVGNDGHQRLPSQIGGWNAAGYFAEKLSTLGAAIAFTAPGTPMIFQGQEFLSVGQFQAEVPLDWSRSATYSGIQQLYTDLIHLRRDWNNNTGGLRGNNVNVFHRNDSGKVIAYHRWDQGGGGDDVVVVANFSNTTFSSYTTGFPRSGTWHVRLNSDWQGYSSNFAGTNTSDVNANGGGQDGLPQSGSFSLGPYSLVIFSQDP